MKYPFHEEVQRTFPDFEYWAPAGDRSVLCDFRNTNNQVGHQQRAFTVWWALKQCGPLDLGLDVGSHRGLTPYCIHIDKYYNNRTEHPYYGGVAGADVVCDAVDVPDTFSAATFPLICSNHSLEHMPVTGDVGVADMLNDWVGLLRQGGVIALVVPDNDEFDVLGSDKDHKHAWGHSDFRERVVNRVRGVELTEFNSFENHFSFNAVMKKR